MGVIKLIHNPETTLLETLLRVVIQTIHNSIRLHQMIPAQSATQGNIQVELLRLCTTLYSPWGLHATDVPNTYYVMPVAPHISPT